MFSKVCVSHSVQRGKGISILRFIPGPWSHAISWGISGPKFVPGGRVSKGVSRM